MGKRSRRARVGRNKSEAAAQASLVQRSVTSPNNSNAVSKSASDLTADDIIQVCLGEAAAQASLAQRFVTSPNNSNAVWKSASDLPADDIIKACLGEEVIKTWDAADEAALYKKTMEEIRTLEKASDPVDKCFVHYHVLSPCDGNGDFSIESVFISRSDSSFAFVIHLVLNVRGGWRAAILHHRKFIPRIKSDDKFFIRRQSIRVSFSACAKIVINELYDMKACNRVFSSKVEKLVTRLFLLNTTGNETNQPRATTPPNKDKRKETQQGDPATPPTVESMWRALCRPEYYLWNQPLGILEEIIGPDGKTGVPNEKTFRRAAQHLVNDKCCRDTFASMLYFMVLWHRMNNQQDVSGWMLTELKTAGFLSKHLVESNLENSVVFQLLIHIFFRHRTSRRVKSKNDDYCFTADELYDDALASMREGFDTTPQDIKLSAKVRETLDIIGTEEDVFNVTLIDPMKIAKSLNRNAGCATCGERTGSAGGDLLACKHCKGVLYCCRDHQRQHWKHEHKKECRKKCFGTPMTGYDKTLMRSLLNTYGGSLGAAGLLVDPSLPSVSSCQALLS